MSRVLITGGTGFIGKNLVSRLVAESQHDICLLVREPYGMGTPLPPPLNKLREKINLFFADLRTVSLVNRAVRDAQPDIVIHLAAVGSTDPFLPPHKAVRHNVDGMINLVEACFEKNYTTKKMIVARTPGELTKMNPYAASKLAGWHFCEMYARTRGYPIFGGMIFQAFGPWQPQRAIIPAAMSAALKHEDFPMTAGTQQRDWIHVDDVVSGFQAIQATAEDTKLQPGDTVELGTGKCHSVAKMVETIYEISESQGKPLIGALPSRPGEAPKQIANVEQSKALIGWRPNLSIEAGLRQMQATLETETA